MNFEVNSVVTEADIQAWSWDESITKVKGLYIGSWNTISKELLEELYQAKKQINRGPGNPHHRYSWKQYCYDAFYEKEAGKMMVTQRTVDTWIHRHEIGEEAWKEEQREKKGLKALKTPKPFDDDQTFIEKVIKKDGRYIIRMSFSEYPDMLFVDSFSA